MDQILKKILIVAVMGILFAGFAIGEEVDYYLNYGFDFSNGKYVTSKWVDERGAQKVIWTKYVPDSDYLELYEKYNLGHDKPLIAYVSSTGYEKNYFIRVKVYHSRWKWYFFTDIPIICGDGYSPVLKLLDFMQENDLPPDIARKFYSGCVERFADFKALETYVDECLDVYKKDALPDGDVTLYDEF